MGFPVSPQPQPGDTYSSENRLWTYDGFGWRFLGASGSVNVTLTGNVNYTVGITAPIESTTGDKWFHLNDAVEYTYIQDVNQTSHWIEIGYGCPTLGGGQFGLTGIDFPSTECIGDTYEYDSRIWIFNGYAWKMVCQNTTDPEFTFGLTAPTGIRVGHRWVDSSNGYMYTFVNDHDPSGQTGQWVSFGGGSDLVGPMGPTGPTGPLGPTGPTGPTGPQYLYSLFDVNIDAETEYGPGGDGKVIRFNYATQKWLMVDLPAALAGPSSVESLNGCTGAVGITGTSGEIEITKVCPNITVGLPDNVTITGNITVGGSYYGIIHGGTF
jgi:hypothetical protein